MVKVVWMVVKVGMTMVCSEVIVNALVMVVISKSLRVVVRLMEDVRKLMLVTVVEVTMSLVFVNTITLPFIIVVVVSISTMNLMVEVEVVLIVLTVELEIKVVMVVVVEVNLEVLVETPDNVFTHRTAKIELTGEVVGTVPK